MRNNFFQNISKSLIFRHISVWLLLLPVMQILSPAPGNFREIILTRLLSHANYILMYYTLSLIVFPYFYKKNIVLLLFILSLCFLIFLNNYVFTAKKLFTLIYNKPLYEKLPLQDFIKACIYRYFFITLIAWSLFRNAINSQKLNVVKN